MDAWKYEIISRVKQDIHHSFTLFTCEISWSTLEINFIFPHIHILFSICSLTCYSLPHFSISLNFINVKQNKMQCYLSSSVTLFKKEYGKIKLKTIQTLGKAREIEKVTNCSTTKQHHHSTLK